MSSLVGRRRLASRVAELIETRSPFWWVALPLLVIYMLTPTTVAHIDPTTNAVTGWHLGMTGSVLLPEYQLAIGPDYYRNVGWYVASPRGPVSQYPPGAAALAAPFYRIWGQGLTVVEVSGSNRPHVDPIPLGIPPPTPAKLAAAVATAVAMGLVASTVPLVGGSHLAGVAVGYVGGLATSMWSVSASALWQHGPAAMWVALGVYLSARNRLWWAGLAFGAAVLTRPHLALVAAAVGVAISLDRRQLAPILKLGAGSVLGMVGLVGYNWWLWGEVTFSGGYGTGLTGRLVEGDVLGYLTNLAGALFDPSRGLLLVSPFLAVLIIGARSGWMKSPPWAKGAAIGAVAYLLVQYKANRFSGGEGFTGYRYPLEALTAAGVLLTLGYLGWVKQRPLAVRVFWLGVVAAVAIQVV